MSAVRNGPLRLVMLRSGKYDYAEVELDLPAHLVGPNNVGKTSLIAALQFLYVDEQRQMHFARPLEETRRYYFPDPNSYILFECRTPTGFQVLGVRGLGPLKGYDFERFAFQGRFEATDFIAPDRSILPPDQVRANLAVKGYTRLEPRHLKAALTGIGDGKGVHLGLVPLRNRDHYHRFRTVFRNILRLAHLRQDELKDLVLDIYRADFQQVEIDLEQRFADLFARVKREAYELGELKALADQVRAVTAQQARRIALHRRLPRLWDAIQAGLETERARFEEAERGMTAERAALERSRQETASLLAARKEELRRTTDARAVLRDRLQQLDEARNAFRDFVPELAEQEAALLQADLDRLGRAVHDAAAEPASRVERRLARCEREIAALEHTLAGIEQALAGRLRRDLDSAGLADLFRLCNPAILGLVEGEEARVHDHGTLLAAVRDLLGRVAGGVFHGPGIEITLAAIPPPDLEQYSDPRVLAERIEELRHARERDREQLDACRRAAELERERQEKRREYRRLVARIEAHRQLVAQEARADGWRAEEAELGRREAECAAGIADLESRLADLDARERALAGRLDAARREYERMLALVRDLDPPDPQWREATEEEATHPEDPLEQPADLAALARIYGREAQEAAHLSREIGLTLRFIEQRTYGRYPAAEEAATIARLAEEVDGLAEKERAVQELWTSIAVGLRSSFKGLQRDLEALKERVGRLNRALKGVGVSNLARLRLVVAERPEWMHHIREMLRYEAMPLFADPDRTREAVEGLGHMLARHRRVDLADLFDLHFEVHGTDGEARTYPHLENIESHGTTITIKVLVNLILLRGLLARDDVRLPYYLDEVSSLDHNNLQAIVDQSRALGFTPILASPDAMAVADNIYFLTEEHGRVVLEPKSSLLRLDRRHTAGRQDGERDDGHDTGTP